MTTVVAAEIKGKKRNKVVFASDSQVSFGHRKESLPDGKIIKNGDITFGFAGSVRVLNILKHAKLPPVPKSKRRIDIERWAIQKLIPAMRKALRNEEAIEFDRGEANTSSALLIAVNGRLFEVGGDFSYTTNDNRVYAVGSGSSYALGALGAGAEPAHSVAVAAYFDAFTGGEVHEVVL